MVATFMKFGRRVFMEKFRDEGLLYMKPLKYFIDLENDENRADRHEGLAALYRGELIEIALGGHTLTHADGLMSASVRPERADKINIFCMYSLKTDYLYVDPRNADFGDTVVCITNVREFLVRLRAALKGRNAKADLVEYVDPDLHHGGLGPFRKFQKFSYQNEYRIVLWDGQPDPIDLFIGSLRDISLIRDSRSVNDDIQLASRLLPPKRG